MSTELSTINPEIMFSLIINGDVAKLSSAQRVEYITKLCERVGIDPLTQPFKILRLSGKEVLYADKGCTQQLCRVYGISTEVTKKEKIEDVYVVTVRASNKDGRFTDEDGAVCIGSLKGDALANALMKTVTKAKRRAVLAFCGLGMLDETEIETIKGANVVDINEEPLKMPVPKPLPDNQKPVQDAPVSKDNESTKDMPNPVPSPDDKLLDNDGLTLMENLRNSKRTKEDLKTFIFKNFGLKKLSEICYKHLDKINEFIKEGQPCQP